MFAEGTEFKNDINLCLLIWCESLYDWGINNDEHDHFHETLAEFSLLIFWNN